MKVHTPRRRAAQPLAAAGFAIANPKEASDAEGVREANASPGLCSGVDTSHFATIKKTVTFSYKEGYNKW